jgi:S1-C subfamily serine protease
MHRKLTRIVAVTSGGLVLTGAAAGAGAAVYAGVAPSTPQTVVRQVTVAGGIPAASGSTLTVGEVYTRAREGVVEITVTAASSPTSFGQDSGTQRAQGSGFVYDEEGHIVTNQHVVDGAKSASVQLWNGDTYEASVVGTDPSTDLAVLDIDAPASVLEPLPLGDSTELAVGDGVVAIGSPLGLTETVTTGIVSALDRQMEAPNGYTINDSIQTDAAINHGNSGGPLLDLQGEVVGVNSQIASDSGGNDGIGFAVPSNTVESIVSQLLGDGTVEHAYLGVTVAAIPASAASALGLAEGVEVAEIKAGSPAAKAGLEAATGSKSVAGAEYPTGGDVITAVDGKAVSSAAELQKAIDARKPGETVSITYVRDGHSRSAEVELANRPT